MSAAGAAGLPLGGAASPETALVLACSRLELRDEDKAAIDSALQRGVNWDVLLSRARWHGIIGFVHKHLGAGSSTAIPAAVVAALETAAARMARNNLRLSGELIALLRLFADHRIPVLPLKGPVLAELIYGSIALRKIIDLDLLFREADVPKVVELLATRGYQTWQSFPAEFEDLDRRDSQHLAFVCREREICVEVHHCLLGQRHTRHPLDVMLPRTLTASFMGVSILTLSADDLLVYLCEHGSNHVWCRLEWICAVAELLRSGRIRSWDRVFAFADEFKGGRRLRTSLCIARDLLGSPVPDAILGHDAGSDAAARSVVARLRNDADAMPTSAEAFRYLVATNGGELLATLRRFGLTLVTPDVVDLQWVALPRSLWHAYYVLRPLRMLIGICQRRVFASAPFRGD